MAQTNGKPVILGRITGLFGVKGWFKVRSYTEPREAILDYRDWLLLKDGHAEAARLAEGKRHGKTVIASLEGCDDRDAAAEYVDSDIGVLRENLPEISEGEFYWADLEGLEVVHTDGRSFGKVAYLLATGANDVLVVRGDREVLIPFVKGEIVKDVDLEAGVINVDWEWE
ncbi:MAG: ribosome maturation factor RimM [Woeseiaceae bacterium]|nr:ribosome maturation factor RimM [Woeseiaceae bacterium]